MRLRQLPLWCYGMIGGGIACGILLVYSLYFSPGDKFERIKAKLLTLEQVSSEAELSRILGKPDAITSASQVGPGGYCYVYERVDDYQFKFQKRFPYMRISKEITPLVRVPIYGRDMQKELARINRLFSVKPFFARGVVIQEYDVTPSYDDWRSRRKPTEFQGCLVRTQGKALPIQSLNWCIPRIDVSKDLEVITYKNVARLQKIARIDNAHAQEIIWNPDGDQFVLLGWQRPVQIMDAINFHCLQMFEKERRIFHFAFSPDPNVIAYTGDDILAECFNLHTGQRLFFDSRNIQPTLRFTPDGKSLATGGEGKAVRLWDISSGELLREWDGGGDVRRRLKIDFSEDGQYLAVSRYYSNIQLFDFQTGERLFTFDEGRVYDIKFHPYGKVLAASYVDGRIRLWSTLNGDLLGVIQPKQSERILLDWTADGDMIVAKGGRSGITFYRAADLIVLHHITEKRFPLPSIEFNPAGTILLSIERDHVNVWGCPRVEIQPPL